MFLFVLLFGLTIQNTFSQDAKPLSNESPLPAPTAPVNDYAGVIDDNTEAQINQKIIAFRDKSNPRVELAVAVVKTTGGRDIFDYSLAVARSWGIGSKETDNPGALLLIAIDDRKYFTQVSRDLEDELSDGLAGSLQRQYLVPAFKQSNYGKGISDTIDAYISTIQAKQTGAPAPIQPQQRSKAKDSRSTSGTTICIVIIVILVFIVLSRGGRGGGSGGGGGGSFWLPLVLGSIINNAGSSSSSGSSWGGGSGGGSSGGDSGGGWGGFGGGGDFGGGGAGGDW